MIWFPRMSRRILTVWILLAGRVVNSIILTSGLRFVTERG